MIFGLGVCKVKCRSGSALSPAKVEKMARNGKNLGRQLSEDHRLAHPISTHFLSIAPLQLRIHQDREKKTDYCIEQRD